MLNKKLLVVTECYQLLSRSEFNDCDLNAVYAKEEKGEITVFALAYKSDDNDRAAGIYGKQGELYIKDMPEWHYSQDEYDFEFLEEGGEVLYIHPDCHYNMWCSIEEIKPENFHNKKGMLKYVDYCRTHGVTKEHIEKVVGLKLDIDILKEFAELRLNGNKESTIAKTKHDDHER